MMMAGNYGLVSVVNILFYSSDGRAARVSASGAVDSGLVSSRVKPMILKLVGQLPCLTLSIKGTVRRTSRQVYLLCR